MIICKNFHIIFQRIAPFFANLFLAFYRIKWVNDQQKVDVINICKINNAFRFIDDLSMIFEEFYKNIHPKEMELKKENTTKLVRLFSTIILKLKMVKLILN